MMQVIRRKDAIAQGLKRYFTGKPCKHQHIAERNASDGQCMECAKAKCKRMRVKHKDKRLAYAAQYRKNNRDIIAERTADWRQRNTDAIKAYSKEYYWQNLQSCKRRRKEWGEKNREYVLRLRKEYYENNLEKCKASSQRWKANNKDRISIYNAMKRPEREERLRKATPDWVDMNAIILKYKERDCMTQVTGLPHHVDHKVPLKGENICGLHVPWNLRVIPARDNLSKSNKWETV